MFYESQRIVRKQAIYVNQKAREMIDNFKAKEMAFEEVIAALELLLEEKDSIDSDIVKRALVILNKQGKL